MITRYDPDYREQGGDIFPCTEVADDGDYVLYENYLILEQQLYEATKECDEFAAIIENLREAIIIDGRKEVLLKLAQELPTDALTDYRANVAIEAHMAGQADAGVDPSYSNAQAYALKEKE